jgi:predicted  nucleic acid-binding Zn-ribbon protein
VVALLQEEGGMTTPAQVKAQASALAAAAQQVNTLQGQLAAASSTAAALTDLQAAMREAASASSSITALQQRVAKLEALRDALRASAGKAA